MGNIEKAGTVKPMSALKSILSAPSVVQQFESAIGKSSRAFMSSIVDLFGKNTQLQACDPNLIVKEALRAAVLNLPLSDALGFAYIVPFNNTVRNADGTYEKKVVPTFMIGYRGLIQLALRSGCYRTINADVVYEGELAGYDKISGRLDLSGTRVSNNVVGYFAHTETTNGFAKTYYMTVEDMVDYALRYSPTFKGRGKVSRETLLADAIANKEGTGVGWSGNFTSMALKTVMRHLLNKYGQLSIENQTAIAEEVRSEYQTNTETGEVTFVEATVVPTEPAASDKNDVPY